MYSVTVSAEGGCGSAEDSIHVSLAAEAITTVSLPVIEAAPGDTIVIPLKLLSERNLYRSGATRYRTTIQYNGTLMEPIDPFYKSAMTSEGEIVFDGTLPQATTGGDLARIRCIVMLGDAESTPLHIEVFDWTDGKVSVIKIDGELRINNICREGGTRLFSADGEIDLKPVRPNPVSSVAQIEYEVVEQGRTELYITDLFGRTVKTLVDGDILPGHYVVTFNAADLLSGPYQYVLQTPTKVLSRQMIIRK